MQLPEQNHQVHNQEDAIDPRLRCSLKLCSDIVQPVTILPLTKLAFDWNPLPAVQDALFPFTL